MSLTEIPKQELIRIALHVEASLRLRYEAARELQRRRQRWALGQANQVWWSLNREVNSDMERLLFKINQLRDEMEASGVPAQMARQHIHKVVFGRMENKVRRPAAGKARKHVIRKAVQG